MKRELESFISKFVKEIKEDNAAIFAGAGLSVASGLVNWKELLREIAQDVHLDVDKETDLVSLAQFYVNEKGGKNLITTELIGAFTKDVTINPNHKLLASLPIKTFWTTNYDNLIETALAEYGKTVDTKICAKNLANNKPRRDAVVYKMHGDISLAHDAVLTKDDYEKYNETRQLFTTTLQGDLVSKTFLFIGFSFEDPNLDYILSRVRILLGENARTHYCFFRAIDRRDYTTDEEYAYDKVRQELRIKDLKRFGIQALLVDEYSDITEVLKHIQIKLKRQNIFISGAAHEYGRFAKPDAEKLIYDISHDLASKDHKVISGFGLGIGSSVINGVLSYVYNSTKKHLDDYLIMRPFPQTISDASKRKALWRQYREDMLLESGIAIFFFGNKLAGDQVIDSDGLLEEFEIAHAQGVKVIPVGTTGYVAKQLWEKVQADFNEYYPDNDQITEAIAHLGDSTITDEEIRRTVLKLVSLLQGVI